MSQGPRPAVWQMVKEAVEALNGNTTNVAVRNWILRKYPGTNEATIRCQIIACTVNHPSRVYYPMNTKPRPCNTQYDLLYRPERGRLESYVPQRHGQWEIVQREDGALTVAKTGEHGEEKGQPAEGTEGGGFAAESQLRDYLASRLELVEDGLQLYVDDYGNTGVEYETPVGRVDLLAEDSDGGLVVIELKVARPPDSVVGQLLRYMGWVRRHMAAPKPLRGVIIAAHASERIRYAVADLPDVCLKEYTLNLTVRDVGDP